MWDSTFAVAFNVFLSRGKAHSPLSRFPSRELSRIIILPTSFFLSLTRPAPLSAHKQKIHQNVWLDPTRVAIIFLTRICILKNVKELR